MCVCVFLFSIDCTNRLTNVCVCVCSFQGIDCIDRLLFG